MEAILRVAGSPSKHGVQNYLGAHTARAAHHLSEEHREREGHHRMKGSSTVLRPPRVHRREQTANPSKSDIIMGAREGESSHSELLLSARLRILCIYGIDIDNIA